MVMTDKTGCRDVLRSRWQWPLLLAVVIAALVPGCDGDGQDCGDARADSNATAGSRGVAVERDYEKGPFELTVRLDKDEITLAEIARLELQAVAEEGIEIDFPEIAETLDRYELRVMEPLPVERTLLDDGRVLRRKAYPLEPITPGDFEIPEMTVLFRDVSDSPGTEYDIVVKPIPVTVVASAVEQSEEVALTDIKGMMTLPQRFGPQSQWWWLAVGIAAALAGGLLWWWLRRRRGSAGEVPRVYRKAHELALERLAAIDTTGLDDEDRVKACYEQVSYLLRWYIEHRFQLRAPEQTTEEFFETLKAMEQGGEGFFHEVLSEEQQGWLGQFLEHCDMVKFAKYLPSPDERRRAVALTREFIESTRDENCLVDVTEQADRRRPAA